VGVGGGDQAPPFLPPFDQIKGVGVFGMSAQAEGVIAQGSPQSAGLKASGKFGVVADGSDFGVMAKGSVTAVDAEGGMGVAARGIADVAGLFQRLYQRDNRNVAALPQVRMEPHPMWVGNSQAFQPVAFPPGSADQLPKDGKAGDFLVTIRTERPDSTNVPAKAQATLWLCVTSGDSDHDPAIWKEVLLGRAIAGQKPRP
jgi:hypothetical protein